MAESDAIPSASVAEAMDGRERRNSRPTDPPTHQPLSIQRIVTGHNALRLIEC